MKITKKIIILNLCSMILVACNGNSTSAENTAPVAGAKAIAANVYLGRNATFDASSSHDDDGDVLTYKWSLESFPEGSNALLEKNSSVSPQIIPDVEGTYELKLVVNDGSVDSEPVRVTFDAHRETVLLDFIVKDADYSKALDKIIMTGYHQSDTDDTNGEKDGFLYIYDPVNNQQQPVKLPHQSGLVSLSPDGLYAVVYASSLVSIRVAENSYVYMPDPISYIDLSSAELINTLSAPDDAYHNFNERHYGDIILANNGKAYGIPLRNSVHGYSLDNGVIPDLIHSLDMVTGQVSRKPLPTNDFRYSFIDDGNGYPNFVYSASYKLHPNGYNIYGISNIHQTDDLPYYAHDWTLAEKITLDSNDGSDVKVSSPSGDFCSEIWFSEEGGQLVNSCGRVYKILNDTDQTLLDTGKFSEVYHLGSLSHSLAAKQFVSLSYASKTYEVENSEGISSVTEVDFNSGVVSIYNSSNLVLEQTKKIPQLITSENTLVAQQGQFVFFNSSGDEYYLLTSSNNGTGIVTY